MSELIKKEYDIQGFSKLSIGGPGKVILNQGDDCALTIEAPEDFLESLVVIKDGDTLKIRVEPMGMLQWIFNRGFRFNEEKVTYTISMARIEELRFSGALKILAGPIETNDLKINNSGSVHAEFEKIIARGKLSLSNSGSIKANCTAIETDDLHLSASGAADLVVLDLSAKTIEAHASGSMKLSIEHGSVQHQEYRISGSGSVDAVQLESNTAKVSISGSGKASIWVEDSLTVSISGSGAISYKGNAKIDQHISGSGKVKNIQPEMEPA